MPKVQLNLTHTASYALKKVPLMQFFFSEAVVVIATYHGKAIIGKTAPQKSNDDMTEK